MIIQKNTVVNRKQEIKNKKMSKPAKNSERNKKQIKSIELN